MCSSGSSYSSQDSFEEKLCVACETVKSTRAFYKHPRSSDGLGQKCKDCISTENKHKYQCKKDKEGSFDALYIFSCPLIPGLIKIGRSDTPGLRADQMSVGWPFQLVVEHIYPRCGSLELAVHSRIDCRRAKGGKSREWFWLDSEVADTIIQGIFAEHELVRRSQRHHENDDASDV